MKVFSGSIRVTTSRVSEDINITERIAKIVKESGISDGMVLIFTPHTTASLYINYKDRGLEEDLINVMNDMVPEDGVYKHSKGGYGSNAPAHIKSLLLGRSITIPVTRGVCGLGQWQTIYFSEFNGPRPRLISVKVMGLTGL
ncbi:MAG: secondary thiamine-phosphate synthase enzyme YjbQ [Thermodesulfobacteriota bacterium]